MKEYWFRAEYRPYVSIKTIHGLRRKHYTADVSLHLPAKDRKSAMNQTIATLVEQGYKYAPLNTKYIKLRKLKEVI